jgi:hypothetical protein
MKTKRALAALIREMLRAFDGLGRDPMARIDARRWTAYFQKKAIKLGIEEDK